MEQLRPLEGISVLDLTHVLAGPYCTLILGDMGAEVIKIERLGEGDQTRTIPPFVNGVSHYFLAINRNKKSVTIDLKSEAGLDLVRRLIATCDILVENFRPGVLDSLGLGPATLQSQHPELVICSISGYGQTGAFRTRPSFDLVTQAISGIMSINGEPDGPPVKLGIPMGDLAGGLWGAIAVLAGLQHRNATGRGVHIDLSLVDGLMALLGYLGEIYLVTGESPGRVGNSHHSVVPYGRFAAKDGHIVIALHVGSFWRKFCAAIDRPDLLEDPRFRTTADRQQNRDALDAIVSELLLARTMHEWHEILDAADVPNGPILSVGEALEQPHAQARELLATMHHPVAGDVPVVRSALRFDGTLAAVEPAPLLGEHTRLVLEQRLGLTGDEVDRLVAANVVSEAVPNTTSTTR
jgi:crotonobetainyl-CoA:carnitine CoA-transferase CaiB-like acyl-CoA transferase